MYKNAKKKIKNAVQSNEICRYFKIVEQFFLIFLKAVLF